MRIMMLCQDCFGIAQQRLIQTLKHMPITHFIVIAYC